ncbi:hypothetical protein ACLOJK_037591 [Asimina triloba]
MMREEKRYHRDGSVAVDREKEEEEADNLLVGDMALVVLWSAGASLPSPWKMEVRSLPSMDTNQRR